MKLRRKKIILGLLVVVAFMAVAAAVLIPRLLDPNRYHALIVEQIEESLGGDVRLGQMRWGIAGDIWFEIDGLSVTGTTAFPVDFDLPGVSGRVAITPLLAKKVIVHELRLKNPSIVVRRHGWSAADGRDSGSAAAEKTKAGKVESRVPEETPVPEDGQPSASESSFDLWVKTFHFNGGQVALESASALEGQTTITAGAFPEGVTLENLQGKISINEKKRLDLVVEEFSGSLNGIPFRIDGEVRKTGTPKMLIDVEVHTDQLDLGHAAAFIPQLKGREIEGKLHMDVDVYLPYARPEETRMTGKAKLSDFGIRFPDRGMTVQNGHAEFSLSGDVIELTDGEIVLNDQKIRISGKAKNPNAPEIEIRLESPSMDLGRLIPFGSGNKRPLNDLNEKKTVSSTVGKKTGHQPNLFIRQTTARVSVDVEKGQCRQQAFQNLHFEVDYGRGQITNFEAGVDLDKSSVHTEGSADPKDPDRLTFVFDPDLRKVEMEHVMHCLGVENPPIVGPVSVSGHLDGHSGDTKTFLTRLRGDLKYEAGPGRLTEMSLLGKWLDKILGFINLKFLDVSKWSRQLEGEGMSFNRIQGDVSFDAGTATIKEIAFDSDALDMTGSGTIKLVEQKMDMGAEVLIVGAVNRTMDFVPLVGKAASDLTKIYLTLKGPLTDPVVSPAPTKRLTSPVKKILDIPGKALGNRK